MDRAGPPPPPFDPRLLQMQGLDLDALRAGIRRRITLLLVGIAIIIVGTQIDPGALGWPVWVPATVWVAGMGVSALGLLGLTAGMGCLAQVLMFMWIGGLVCNASAASNPTSYVLAAAVVAASLSAIVLRRRAHRQRAARVAQMQFPGMPGFAPDAGGDTGPAASGVVIDVEAHDKPREE